MDSEIKNEFENLARMIKNGFDETARRVDVDKRFDNVDKRFEDVYGRFDKIDSRFDDVDNQLHYLEQKLGVESGK